MAYTVAYCNRFMDELLDKMGSDYFPLPIKLARFQSIVLQFIRESSAMFEGTQEISDDISPWTTTAPKTLTAGRNFQYMGKKFFKIEYPEDYIRLLNVIPYTQYPTGGYSTILNAEIKLYKIGNFQNNERNPFRSVTAERVNVYRMENSVLIDTTEDVNKADLSYIRTPIFGENPDDLMIDHPNDLIVDKLMHKTCVSLRATSSDADTQLMDELTERQGQKTR